jgi:uncharacterized protein (TIGR02117 family)
LIASLFFLSSLLRQDADTSLFPAMKDTVHIEVIDHGYHAGLILPLKPMLQIASREQYPKLHAALLVFDHFEKVEIGWGEKDFYQNVRIADISAIAPVTKAMLSPFNKSVLHLVGMDGPTRTIFPTGQIIALSISDEGMKRIARYIEESFENHWPIGSGLYGPSAFFDGTGHYSLFNTCNHWIGKALSKAGVPYAPVESFISAGLMFDLKRRAFSLTNSN